MSLLLERENDIIHQQRTQSQVRSPVSPGLSVPPFPLSESYCFLVIVHTFTARVQFALCSSQFQDDTVGLIFSNPHVKRRGGLYREREEAFKNTQH